jgi:hypothetical protein
MGDVMMSYGEVIPWRGRGWKVGQTCKKFLIRSRCSSSPGLGVIYRASTRRTARQVLCGWQQKLAGEGWTRIPTRQDAVALRNQIRVVTCMFRHVRLSGQDPLHGQLSRAGVQGRLVKTPSRAQPMGKTGGYKHMESA